MGLKDMISNMRERSKERKDKIRQMDEDMRIQEVLENRRKSSNERELEMFQKENREEDIKVQLQKVRKIRDEDIKFAHNPLDTPNVTNHADWNVLKDNNIFKGKSNMFSNSKSIHKNNPNLLKNNQKLLKSNMRLMK